MILHNVVTLTFPILSPIIHPPTQVRTTVGFLFFKYFKTFFHLKLLHWSVLFWSSVLHVSSSYVYILGLSSNGTSSEKPFLTPNPSLSNVYGHLIISLNFIFFIALTIWNHLTCMTHSNPLKIKYKLHDILEIVLSLAPRDQSKNSIIYLWIWTKGRV